jgi:adenine-specific DNA-methyltransferase
MNPWSQKITEYLEEKEIDALLEIDGFFKANLGEVELPKTLFNRAHSSLKQRIKGITYTPEPIRRELTKVVLGKLEESLDLSKTKICDPCCGSGLFSITLLEELVSRSIPPKEAIERIIFFGDIDPLSVGISLANLYWKLRSQGYDCEDWNPNFYVEDFLSKSELHDAYITNPPYVKLQNLDDDYRIFLKQKFPETFSGSLGLAPVFLQHMFETLTGGGIAGVITQNNFFTSTSGKALRTYLGSHILKIDTFGSEYIFEDVSAYTCLLYITSKITNTFEYRKISDAAELMSAPVRMETSKLDHSKWRLGSETEVDYLQRMESLGTPLGKACRIWVGIATQYDKAFVVNRVGEKWISTGPANTKMEVEEGAVKKLIKIADLGDQSSVKEITKGVIYPYSIVLNKAFDFSEDEFRSLFPLAYSALALWKRELLSRQKGKVSESDWFKWGRVQSMIPVARKLLTKTFNKGPCFYFDESDALFSNGYALTVRDSDFDLEFVRVVLNSKLFEKYAKLTSFEIKGGYQCYQKNFIEKFCLPDFSLSDQRGIVSGEIDVDDALLHHFKLKPDFLVAE